MHQSNRARSTLGTANGFTLMKIKILQCNGWLLLWSFDGDQKKNEGKIPNFERPCLTNTATVWYHFLFVTPPSHAVMLPSLTNLGPAARLDCHYTSATAAATNVASIPAHNDCRFCHYHCRLLLIVACCLPLVLWLLSEPLLPLSLPFTNAATTANAESASATATTTISLVLATTTPTYISATGVSVVANLAISADAAIFLATAATCRPCLQEQKTVAVDAMVKSVWQESL